MAWKDRLVDASFRGVAFKVETEDAGVGRRVETHEFPNRDKPYTEDLGKVSFRPNISAYVIGEDCYDQRDRLIEALNKPGPGTLIHPSYGEVKVCVDGEARVSTTASDGRMVRFDLRFVEAGELSYPTSGAATAQNLTTSCSALDDCISNNFDNFSIDGVADFIQNDVIGTATEMMGYVTGAMKVVDAVVSDAARLMQGDISVLLPPPSSGKTFVNQLQTMWRAGNRLYGNASDLFTMIKTFSGISLGSDLQPRGVWKTDSVTTKTIKQQSNYVASAIRTTAISEAAAAVVNLPSPTSSTVTSTTASEQTAGWPAVSHPALNNATEETTTAVLPTWDELVDIRDTLNQAIDKEMSRTNDDQLFLALRRVKVDVNADINDRLQQTQKTVIRTPSEVTPALVLAATWYDNAARESDIVRRNAVAHPGFVPVTALRVPVQ
ncbi:DNA circularization N-terminal domain-containing protein [Kosakonia sp. ML.JS2a]|uniref:DNA circularization protein n=1 Tax=Kosakonia sp. ML.JS2a TaxID=2980557 RepID=UPI0021DA89EC|nr:DNA circularization N-terminal domain-containing protein [Kosakonia sp. ML.JS2a]UXY12079.1 DNA circularization N-terminal domain-containing protein [Kosakonia sp. ML.JS2a]